MTFGSSSAPNSADVVNSKRHTRIHTVETVLNVAFYDVKLWVNGHMAISQ